mmetsp:Transcript_107326/g.167690  ORF Transcript_107326/g.167690 Transcript_107326/m.167690 type:complete len:708 (+) Transcript_107326:105-2228(+)
MQSLQTSAPDCGWGSTWNWKEDVDSKLQTIQSQLQAFNAGMEASGHSHRFYQKDCEMQKSIGTQPYFMQSALREQPIHPRSCPLLSKPNPGPSPSGSLIAWATSSRRSPASPVQGAGETLHAVGPASVRKGNSDAVSVASVQSLPENSRASLSAETALPSATNVYCDRNYDNGSHQRSPSDHRMRRVIEIPVEMVAEEKIKPIAAPTNLQEMVLTYTSSAEAAFDAAMERLNAARREIDEASDFSDFAVRPHWEVAATTVPSQANAKKGDTLLDGSSQKVLTDDLPDSPLAPIVKFESDGLSEHDLDTLSFSIESSENLRIARDRCQAHEDDRDELLTSSDLVEYHWQTLYNKQLDTLSATAKCWVLRAVLMGWASVVHFVWGLRRIDAWLQKGVAKRARKMLQLWYAFVHEPLDSAHHAKLKSSPQRSRHEHTMRFLTRIAQSSFLLLVLRSWYASARKVARQVRLVSLEASAKRMKVEHQAAVHMLAATRVSDRARDLQAEIVHAWHSVVHCETRRTHAATITHAWLPAFDLIVRIRTVDARSRWHEKVISYAERKDAHAIADAWLASLGVSCQEDIQQFRVFDATGRRIDDAESPLDMNEDRSPYTMQVELAQDLDYALLQQITSPFNSGANNEELTSPRDQRCLHEALCNDLSPLARSTVVIATSASMAAAVSTAARRIVDAQVIGSAAPLHVRAAPRLSSLN